MHPPPGSRPGPAGRRPTMEVASMGISSKSKKKEAAFLFIQWNASKEVVAKMLPRGIPAARVSAWKDPRFLAEAKRLEAEREEIAVIREFMPKQMDEGEAYEEDLGKWQAMIAGYKCTPNAPSSSSVTS